MLTFVLRVRSFSEEGPWSKVDQLDLIGVEVNQDVLILYVSVDHTHRETVSHCLNDLSEQISGGSLTHHPLLCDVVKEINVFIWLLHHNIKVLYVFKVVQHLDDEFVL